MLSNNIGLHISNTNKLKSKWLDAFTHKSEKSWFLIKQYCFPPSSGKKKTFDRKAKNEVKYILNYSFYFLSKDPCGNNQIDTAVANSTWDSEKL